MAPSILKTLRKRGVFCLRTDPEDNHARGQESDAERKQRDPVSEGGEQPTKIDQMIDATFPTALVNLNPVARTRIGTSSEVWTNEGLQTPMRKKLARKSDASGYIGRYPANRGVADVVGEEGHEHARFEGAPADCRSSTDPVGQE